MIRFIVHIALTALILLAPMPALAHKVIAAVFISGDMIEGEIGFSNGEMAVDQLVEVYDPTGAKIGETVTDDDGFFVFQPTGGTDHIFRANLGAGHVAEVIMLADELPGAKTPVNTPTIATPATKTENSGITTADIARIIRDELRPLRREIAAYKEKNNMQTILGGLGYIIGLFGIGFYLAARRRLSGNNNG